MEILIKLMADATLVPILIIAVLAILILPGYKRWQAITKGVVVSLTALWLAKLVSQFYDGGARPFVEKGGGCSGRRA